jgi:hypothetical protein
MDNDHALLLAPRIHSIESSRAAVVQSRCAGEYSNLISCSDRIGLKYGQRPMSDPIFRVGSTFGYMGRQIKKRIPVGLVE